jgi:hypothetical protein
MTDQQTTTKQASTKLGLTAEEAAGAAIAQSVSLAAQNEVDAFRNQNTVNMVAMGVAYAKWLQNPLLSEQFEAVVDSARLSSSYQESVLAKSFGSSFEEPAVVDTAEKPADIAPHAATAPAEKREHSLPVKVFNYFLTPPKKPE